MSYVLTPHTEKILEIIVDAARKTKGTFKLVGVVNPIENNLRQYAGGSPTQYQPPTQFLLWEFSDDTDAVWFKLTYGEL